MKLFIILCLILFCDWITDIVSSAPQCLISNNNIRLDCYPQPNANEKECLARGCCWSEPKQANKGMDHQAMSIPFCFYPTDYPSYSLRFLRKTNRGMAGTLEKTQKTYLPNEIASLNFEVIHETQSRVRIRITDSKFQRFEVPIKLNSMDLNPPYDPNYEVLVSPNGPFSLEVKRKSDNISLFKSFGPLLYSDQFIQISSKMSTDQVYGMGEQNRPFLHQLSNGWSSIGLWARDNAIDTYMNLYGTHPFYMGMPENGKAFGVYYLNSNAQEFVLQPAPAITYRTTGGILDIFIFTGETPEETVKQYVELIGKPMLPPHWSLGFHLSRWGYKNVNEMSLALQRNIDAGIPIDIQWSDIDYMDKNKDFTIDSNDYREIGKYARSIRERYNTRYVMIIDPAISNTSPKTYLPYEDGLEMNIYIKDYITNKPLIGDVWPGDTVYPDFTHPNITKYWFKQIKTFFDSVPIDGLWIDMNEPSSFYDGSKYGCVGNSPYDYPFHVPAIRDRSLIAKTICPSALHYNNTRHYNLHNLYGYSESIITNRALLDTLPNKRPFILSRSTFSGSGKYTFHWTGDNFATWDQLRNSIRQVLNFNMFGIPMTGADICGFIGESNEELCIRWMQLGAFYPFMRNHNTIGARDQDPASWSSEATGIMKDAINIRYSILPNIYTLMVKSHLYGGTVMRPMSFEFFSDRITHSLELQFMIGSSIMVMPTLHEGARAIDAYFPSGIWYDLMGGHELYSGEIGNWLRLDSPLNKINVALRGGHVVSLLDPRDRTILSKENKITLYCAMSKTETASGDLYWDDGENLDTYTQKKYNYIKFTADNNGLLVTPYYLGYDLFPILTRIVIVGLNRKGVKSVMVNNISMPFFYNSQISSLVIENLDLSIRSKIYIQWI